MTSIKCQAKNPALCVDLECPGIKAVSHQMATATTYDQYANAANKQKQDQDNIRRIQLEQQARQGNMPSPLTMPNRGTQAPVRSPQNNNRQRPAGNNPKRRGEFTRDGDPVVKFHRDLGFPPGYTPPSGVRKIVYSNHAKTKQTCRFLYRGELEDDRDICLVLQPVGQGKMMVVTNWINERNDAHRSLRKEEYVIPRQKVA